eukprot:15464871-Alexandrium_andersonii.AAC.1
MYVVLTRHQPANQPASQRPFEGGGLGRARKGNTLYGNIKGTCAVLIKHQPTPQAARSLDFVLCVEHRSLEFVDPSHDMP